jgi:hypothetical protein
MKSFKNGKKAVGTVYALTTHQGGEFGGTGYTLNQYTAYDNGTYQYDDRAFLFDCGFYDDNKTEIRQFILAVSRYLNETDKFTIYRPTKKDNFTGKAEFLHFITKNFLGE